MIGGQLTPLTPTISPNTHDQNFETTTSSTPTSSEENNSGGNPEANEENNNGGSLSSLILVRISLLTNKKLNIHKDAITVKTETHLIFWTTIIEKL
jgi:hypothetical protein